MAEEWKDLEGAELAGFRLERYLAHGGQAAVFVGVNEARRGQRRAIKVVAPHLARDESFKQRFLEEAEALERLSHPNIVGFRDVRIAPVMRGREALRDGQPFMALELELLEGRTLREVEESQARPAVEDVLDWCAQACDGLSAAHAQGLIHRDIKPGNVFVCADGVVKVIDFGIAQAISRADEDSRGRLTKTGHTAGTTLYIAPELWTGGAVTARADLYALGLTMAQVLLGRHPFFGVDGRYPNDAQVMYGHLQDDLRARLVQPSLRLPEAVENLVMRLCARDPAQRPATAAAAATEIRAVRDQLLRAKAMHTGGSITLPRGVPKLPVRPIVAAAAPLPGGPSPAAVTPPAVNTRGLVHAARAAWNTTRAWMALGLAVGTFSLVVGGVYVVRAVSGDEEPVVEQGPDMAGGAAAVAGNLGASTEAAPGAGEEAHPLVAVEVRTPAGHIYPLHLFVDGEDYGPVSGEAQLELHPGRHEFDLRVAGATVARAEAELRAGVAAEVVLAPPAHPNPFVDVAPPPGRLVMGLPRDAPSSAVGWPHSNDPSAQLVAPSEAYRIQAHEVTWGELSEWAGYAEAGLNVPPDVALDMPVTHVSWAQARAYCQALDCPGTGCDLPTEAQWEYAARGPDLRPNSWGVAASAHDTAFAEALARPFRLDQAAEGRGARPNAVTQATIDVTPGMPPVRDLQGNVREWTRDPILDEAGQPLRDERGGRSWYVLRGLPLAEPADSEQSTPIAYRAAACSGRCTNPFGAETGFRCVSPPTPEAAPQTEAERAAAAPQEPSPAAQPVAADASGCTVRAGEPASRGAGWALLALPLGLTWTARRARCAQR